MRKFKEWIIVCIAAILMVGTSFAGTIKTWANGDVLTVTDLNANFQHIHNLMVGGHGARLVNADVSASAAISTSKLAAYRNIPRTWVTLLDANKGCGTAVAACTETSPSGSSLTGTGAGNYTLTLGYTATDSTYGVMLSVHGAGAGATGVCVVTSMTTTTFNIYCESDANPPAAIDSGFTAVVYDDN